MSKASEYAKAMATPKINIVIDDIQFEVSLTGELVIDIYYKLNKSNALKLATWIQDTFGEPEDVLQKTIASLNWGNK